MTQLLIQKQYDPMPVAKEVLSLFSAKYNYLKNVPVDKVLVYEHGMLQYIEREYPYIIDQINKDKALSDDLISQIKTALDAYSKEFELSEGMSDGTK